VIFDELHRDDTASCGGRDVQAATTKRILNWLRRVPTRHQGGLCTAAFSLPRPAGWQTRYDPPENHDSLQKNFSEVEPTKSVSLAMVTRNVVD
jgi:hypothetical protein